MAEKGSKSFKYGDASHATLGGDANNLGRNQILIPTVPHRVEPLIS